MDDINIYRIRIGTFLMPGTKRFKYSVKNSKFKDYSYKLSPSLFGWLILSLVFYSAQTMNTKMYLKCRLPQKLSFRRNALSVI